MDTGGQRIAPLPKTERQGRADRRGPAATERESRRGTTKTEQSERNDEEKKERETWHCPVADEREGGQRYFEEARPARNFAEPMTARPFVGLTRANQSVGTH